jgi:uncharacterized LabA/DUF88 family protein
MAEERADRAYCENCSTKVNLICPNQIQGDPAHKLSNQIQKGVDVGIASLALIHKDNYDTLILSSGDSDLLDAIQHLSEAGKRIELAVFDHGVSTELQSRADKIYWLNNFKDKIVA